MKRVSERLTNTLVKSMLS